MNTIGRVFAIALIITLPGCVVSKSKYEAAKADMESAKAELEKGRMHRDALDKQIKDLKGLNDKMAADLEMMTAEVQRIKESRNNEQAMIKARENDLELEKEKLSQKVGMVTREYKKVKNQNKALKDTVLRYQKELKEARAKKTVKPAASVKPKPASPPRASAPPARSPAKKASPPPATPLPTTQRGGLALVNINSASANDLVLFLGLRKDVADAVVANRPYRLRGELVAKKVVPKATFDVIKDRITAAP